MNLMASWFENECSFFLPKDPWEFESLALLSYEFNDFSLCSYGFGGNSFLLFPGGVARFAIALRDVKFSEPLINGPKPTALQPPLLVS